MSAHPAPLSRRDWLKSAFAAAAASSFTSPLLAATTAVTPPRRVTVGAHAWVYAATHPGNDYTPVLPQVFADFKAAGFDAIELMHTVLRHDDSAPRIRELSQRHQLPVIGTSFTGAMWDREQHGIVLAYARTILGNISKVGGRTFGTSVGQLRGVPPGTRKSEAQLDAQAECLRQVIALGRDLGVVVNLHNHTYEVENDYHDLNGTLARIPDAKLGPDLNWLIRGGGNRVEFIRRHGKRIVFLHLRDQAASRRWGESMGEGATDFTAIGAALHDVGFSSDAVIELAHEKDFQPTRPFRESFRLSREHVRKTMGF